MELSQDFVEKWAKEVECSKKIENLSIEQTKTFLNLARFDLKKIWSDKEEKELTELLESNQGGYASVVWNRIKYRHTYTISLALAVLLGETLDNFGKTTMVCNYLQYVAHRIGRKHLTISEYARNAFPMGFPTEDEWNRLWKLQKIDLSKSDYKRLTSDNGLDYSGVFDSIKDIAE